MIIPRIRLWLPLIAGAITIAGCAGSDTSVATPTAQSSSPHPLEQALLDEVNRYRASHHLKRLMLHSVLTQQARIHSMNMAKGRVPFGHEGFKKRATEIRNYISVINISENLAVNMGYEDPVAVAFQTLMESPGHRKNIEGQFDMTGIGVAKSSDGRVFFTQIFADGAGRFQ